MPHPFRSLFEASREPQRRSQGGTFSSHFSMSFSGRFKQRKTSTSSPFSIHLRDAKSVFFLRKMKVFEGSASTLLLPLSPPFSSPMRPQNPLKMSSKSSSEGCRIQLRFKMAFKIASTLLFEAPRSPQTGFKSHPKKGSRPVFRSGATLFFRAGYQSALRSEFGPLWKRFWTSFGAKLEQF